MRTKTGLSFLLVLMTVLIGAVSSSAQADTTPKKRLKSPAAVKGLIGGEAHDSYLIRARRGQTLTVQISWRREDDNRASFTVSRGADFFAAAPVKFGKESNKGKNWRGKIPATGNYYIYVVAYPTANYSLKVLLN